MSLFILTGEKEKQGAYWYKLLTSRSSRVHKTVYERLHVLEFDSNRKVSHKSHDIIHSFCYVRLENIFQFTLLISLLVHVRNFTRFQWNHKASL